MTNFNTTQIKILKGTYSTIAQSIGCTREYVAMVIKNKRGNKRSGPTADAIRQKANDLLAVLDPKNKNEWN